MQDAWYADNRDLVKWGVLFRLANIFKVSRILQVAYYRPKQFGELIVDGQPCDIPEEVIAHFRDLRMVGSLASSVRVTVFDSQLHDRPIYQNAALALLSAFVQERCIVFLDPDTGLEPKEPARDVGNQFKHVLEAEAHGIWDALKAGDVFALYQHQTNRAGQCWIEPKRIQLADVLRVPQHTIKSANAPAIAQDIAIYYVQKD